MPEAGTVRIDGASLSVLGVVQIAREGVRAEVSDDAWQRIKRGRDALHRFVADGGTGYGVTTGVGSQKSETIADIRQFNRRLLLAHASIASSATLPDSAVRAAMVCLLNGFAQGRSGVRPEIAQALAAALESGTTPQANCGASVGAADLVPLAQIAMAVVGIGDAFSGLTQPGLGLEAKEGLALMSSNAVSLGRGCLLLSEARKLLRGFDLSLALTLEGLRGNLDIVHPAVRRAHPEPGQETCSTHLVELLSGSRLLEVGAARNLQDPLSFRCAPQVHGAAYSALEWLWQNWERELNSVVDNPVIDDEEDRLVSHGNMDTSLLTLGTDTLRAALGNVTSVSAQRLHKLHWPAFSDLPSGLADEPSALGGVQFLNLGHIAEAHASAARQRCHGTMFTYQAQLADGVEDHATLLPLSISETEAVIEQAWIVQALELTVAAWSIHRRGVATNDLGEGLREIYQRLKVHLPLGREGLEVFDLRPVVTMVREAFAV